MALEFAAPECHASGEIEPASYAFDGSTAAGWTIVRNGSPHLNLGPGYQLFRSRLCGVCSTDLARHHLPFPLPQVGGHEVVAADEAGARYVLEINASHRARGVQPECVFCAVGLERHCPERLVLGIHDLP